MRVLDRLDTPAQVASDLGVTLRQNPLAEALLGIQTDYTGLERSMYYRWFRTPTSGSAFPQKSTSCTPTRTSPTCEPSTAGTPMTTKPASSSRPCAATAQSSRSSGKSTKSECRPIPASAFCTRPSGALDLDCQILSAENQTEFLVVFTATPGTEDADRLALLAVIGNETFASTDATS